MIKTYLQNIHQLTSYYTPTKNLPKTTCGILQGSVLCPILFLMSLPTSSSVLPFLLLLMIIIYFQKHKDIKLKIWWLWFWQKFNKVLNLWKIWLWETDYPKMASQCSNRVKNGPDELLILAEPSSETWPLTKILPESNAQAPFLLQIIQSVILANLLLCIANWDVLRYCRHTHQLWSVQWWRK